ncbi:hypothetical protein KJ966_01915 [bacterium]|nr:hypothetical protein [bacterium]
MKLLKSIFLIFLVFGYLTSFLSAQTKIPDSAALRKKRASVLEMELKEEHDPLKLKELAMIYSVIAGFDDQEKTTAVKAEKIVQEAVSIYPKDYELMAVHGSLLTMMARYETETARQLHFTKKGFRKMDRAIKQDPDNIGALLQRGNNSMSVPLFLKRTHYAKKDFQHLLELVGDRKGPSFKAMVLFNLGRAHELLQESSQAKACWKEAKSMNAPYWSTQANEKL